MLAITPAVCEKVGRANGQNRSFFEPCAIDGHLDQPSIPPHLIARRGAVVLTGYFERIAKDPHRIVILIASRVPFSPGGERFPTERNDDLLAPVLVVGV